MLMNGRNKGMSLDFRFFKKFEGKKKISLVKKIYFGRVELIYNK